MIDTLNNQILNEIRSQEDAAKQLTSVNAILIGGYLAVLLNTQSLGVIRDVLIYLPSPKYFAYMPIIPVALWFVSIFCCLLKIIDTKTEQVYTHIGKMRTENLIDILREKRKWLRWGGYLFTVLGLVSILIIIISIIPYQLIGFTQMWNDRGVTLMDLGKYEESLNAFDKAIELNPNYAEAWYNKGRALFELYRLNDSNQAFDKAITIYPNYAEAWYNKGIISAEMQEYDNALNAFDRAIAINHRYSLAWNSKGVVLFMMKDYNRSIDSFSNAIKCNPRCEEAYNNYGVALLINGEYNESIYYFEKAVDLNNDYEEAYKNIESLSFRHSLQRGEFNVRVKQFYRSLVVIIDSMLGNQTQVEDVKIVYLGQPILYEELALGNQALGLTEEEIKIVEEATA